VGASLIEIHRTIKNIVQRSSYGVNGKVQFELQKEQIENMSKGGNGGERSKASMRDTSGQASIRSMHYNDWDDADFQVVLEGILAWESSGELPAEPDIEMTSPIDSVINRSHAIFSTLNRDDQIDALNGLAERLGVIEPEDEATE